MGNNSVKIHIASGFDLPAFAMPQRRSKICGLLQKGLETGLMTTVKERERYMKQIISRKQFGSRT